MNTNVQLMSHASQFHKWLHDSIQIEIALGRRTDELPAYRDYLLRSWLYVAPVAGNC